MLSSSVRPEHIRKSGQTIEIHRVNNLAAQDIEMSKNDKSQIANRKSELKAAFLQLSTYFEDNWRISVFRQLDRILEPREWDEDDRLPSLQSFQTFLCLMLCIKPYRVPGLGLTCEGIVIASWSDEQDHLTIECSIEGDLRWSLISATENGNKTDAGTANITRISSAIAEFRPERWFQT